MMIEVALVVMAVATLAQHLGLIEAVADVISKIARCPMCCTFWSSLVVLVYMGVHPLMAIGASLLAAYLAHWFGLLLILFNDVHTTLWQRVRRKNQRQRHL